MNGNRRKYNRIITVLLLISIFFLTGCGAGNNHTNESQNATPQQNTVQQGNTNQQKGEKAKVYVVSGNRNISNTYEEIYGVVSTDGYMVLPMEKHDVSVITDQFSGEQQFIEKRILTDVTVVQNEWGEGYRESYTNLWFDLDGMPIENPQNRSVAQLAGDVVLCHDGNMYRYSDWTLLAENLYWMEMMNQVIIITPADTVTALHPDGTVAWSVPGYYQGCKNGWLLVSDMNDKYRLLNEEGNEVLPGTYDMIRMEDTPGYVTITEGEFSRVYNLNASLEPIYVTASTVTFETNGGYDTDDTIRFRINEADEYGISMSWNRIGDFGSERVMQRYRYNGEPASEEYDSITTYNTLPGYYLGYRYQPDAEAEIDLLDRDGNVLLSGLAYDVHQLAENRMINNYEVMDMDGNILTENHYYHYYIYPLYSAKVRDVPLLTAAYGRDSAVLTDLLDYDGKVVIPRLRQVIYLDDNLLWVEKGFYQGLMDLQGNWIYRQSVFQTGEDE